MQEPANVQVLLQWSVPAEVSSSPGLHKAWLFQEMSQDPLPKIPFDKLSSIWVYSLVTKNTRITRCVGVGETETKLRTRV